MLEALNSGPIDAGLELYGNPGSNYQVSSQLRDESRNLTVVRRLVRANDEPVAKLRPRSCATKDVLPRPTTMTCGNFAEMIIGILGWAYPACSIQAVECATGVSDNKCVQTIPDKLCSHFVVMAGCLQNLRNASLAAIYKGFRVFLRRNANLNKRVRFPYALPISKNTDIIKVFHHSTPLQMARVRIKVRISGLRSVKNTV